MSEFRLRKHLPASGPDRGSNRAWPLDHSMLTLRHLALWYLNSSSQMLTTRITLQSLKVILLILSELMSSLRPLVMNWACTSPRIQNTGAGHREFDHKTNDQTVKGVQRVVFPLAVLLAWLKEVRPRWIWIICRHSTCAVTKCYLS